MRKKFLPILSPLGQEKAHPFWVWRLWLGTFSIILKNHDFYYFTPKLVNFTKTFSLNYFKMCSTNHKGLSDRQLTLINRDVLLSLSDYRAVQCYHYHLESFSMLDKWPAFSSLSNNANHLFPNSFSSFSWMRCFFP